MDSPAAKVTGKAMTTGSQGSAIKKSIPDKPIGAISVCIARIPVMGPVINLGTTLVGSTLFVVPKVVVDPSSDLTINCCKNRTP